MFEWICAGGMGPEPPRSLRDEGWAMLTALIEDFDRVQNVETLTVIERSCRKSIGSICQRTDPGQARAAYHEMVARADLVLVIAPEFDRLLADHSRWALAAGKSLLGSDPSAIDLAGDKFALAKHFAKYRIPTPATILLDEGRMPDRRPGDFPALCKPRHGAGSQATFLIHDETELYLRLTQARAEVPGSDFLLQPFVPGQPVSVTFLVGPRQTLALQPATQRLSADGRFRYLGGRLPLPESLARRAIDLGQQAISTVDGLGGLVGVDLVLGEAADGGEDKVIEINPRPTTSYIGLRQLAEDNLADAALRIARGGMVAPIRYRRGLVQFSTARAGQGARPGL